ncbi:Scr1 family TA system antitoxin-like transcriptional regulator [Streptomyces fildesensis]|uniref:Scr1 family TA system antitoxin-like transcriptional regulator n=1 Tax=Streptomyces fildesensis TaxID=375757 RepID=UPI0018E03F55|nr:Scr1 family TA system antitoxin-like transcriptional regulator [Streptomyces fildesensis]
MSETDGMMPLIRSALSALPQPAGLPPREPDTAFPATPPARVILGAYLRALRRNQGLSQDAVSRRVHCTIETLARTETAARKPSEHLVTALLRVYQVKNPAEIDAVQQLVLRTDGRNFVIDDKAGYGLRLAACEAIADSLCVHAQHVIPPIVQTAAYTAALHHSRRPPVPRALGPRDDRTVLVLLDETVLTRPVAGPAVMEAQITHLLHAIKDGIADVRVIPLGSGCFVPRRQITELLFRRGEQRLFVEEAAGAAYSSGPQHGQEASTRLDTAETLAASPDESRQMLENARVRFHDRRTP